MVWCGVQEYLEIASPGLATRLRFTGFRAGGPAYAQSNLGAPFYRRLWR